MNTSEAATEPEIASISDRPKPGAKSAHPDWADRATVVPAWTRFKFDRVRSFLMSYKNRFGLEGLYRFGSFFAFCEYLLDYNRRRRVGARLDLIAGGRIDPAERRRLILSWFRRTRCDKMLYTIFDGLGEKEFTSRVDYSSLKTLDAAREGGNGVYVAMSHYGSHHVAAMIMAFLKYPIAGVRDRNEGALRRYIQMIFAERFPDFDRYRMFYADSFPRDIFRCYRENFVVCSALDVDVKRLVNSKLKSYPAKLHGEVHNFLAGPIQMALRCNAPVYQGFVVAREGFHYELRVRPLIADPGKVDRSSEEVVAQALQDYADGIAEFVSEHPCHFSRI